MSIKLYVLNIFLKNKKKKKLCVIQIRILENLFLIITNGV